MYKRKEIIGDCTLYLGDCIEVMPTLGEVDAVVTDPPYGIGLAGGFSGAVGFSEPIKRREYKGDWDSETPNADVFNAMQEISASCIVWGGNYFTDKLQQGSFWLVWDKQNTMPTFSDCELAWTNLKKKSVKRLVYMQNGCMSKERERFHPTQKPVGVMEWCITHLPENTQTILDPFMGSGTTLVACAKMGRAGIGIELDEDYFNIACKRVEDAYRQGDLFVEKEKPAVAEQESLNI